MVDKLRGRVKSTLPNGRQEEMEVESIFTNGKQEEGECGGEGG